MIFRSRCGSQTKTASDNWITVLGIDFASMSLRMDGCWHSEEAAEVLGAILVMVLEMRDVYFDPGQWITVSEVALRCLAKSDISAFTMCLPTEDSFVSAILSGHYTVACVECCARWSLKFLLRPP